MKKELRKNILKERMSLTSAEVKNRSTVIAQQLFNMAEYQTSQTIMLYLGFRNEVATDEIIHKSLEANKRILIPITDLANTRLIPSELLDYPGDLTTGTYGILEPKAQCVRPVDPQEIDLVLVPGVAFDPQGNRLGYGGGFYDRFLPATKSNAVFIALAYELQIKEEVYPEPHDYPVHYVITEDKIINAKK